MKFPEMFTMQGEKDYLTLQEAMQYLNVSRATIFNYVKRGLIKRYERQVPHEILYKKSELENLKMIKPKE
jgi:predicted site-specific integrase-resolvase